jgi:aminopeptidase N
MYHTLLGTTGFRNGTDLYFERHDGQAVGCDEFRAAMAAANGNKDLRGYAAQFERWYQQQGTPTVVAETDWDHNSGTFTLRLRQVRAVRSDDGAVVASRAAT